MLCACTSDDILSSAGNSAVYDGDAVYMTVNIKDVGTSTRATEGGYALGTEDERAISSATFYFFDASGNYVTKTELGAISDGTGGSLGDNVEWETATTVAVYGITDGYYPTSMVTVLNQPADFKYDNTTLSDLRIALANASDVYADGTSFVMTTSTYEDSSDGRTGDLDIVTELDPTNFRTEPIRVDEDYPDGGVDVYVERLAVKAELGLADELTIGAKGDTYAGVTEKVTEYTIGEGESKNTYPGFSAAGLLDDVDAGLLAGDWGVAFIGWTLNGTTRNSFLMKNISGTEWSNNAPFTGWNSASDHRSLWGMSYNYGVEHEYPTSAVKDAETSYVGNYDKDEAGDNALDSYLTYKSLLPTNLTDIGIGNAAYCGENTNTPEILKDKTSTGITNALVLAQIGTVTEDGALSPKDLVKWEGELFTVEDFLNKIAADAMELCMTETVQDVLKGMEDNTTFKFGSQLLTGVDLEGLGNAVEKVLYISEEKLADGDSSEDLEAFNGSYLSLVNHGDGNVAVRINAATANAKAGDNYTNGTAYQPATWYHNDGYGEVTIAAEYQKEGSYTWDGESGNGMTANTGFAPAYDGGSSLDNGTGRKYMYFKVTGEITGDTRTALSTLSMLVTDSEGQEWLYLTDSALAAVSGYYHGTQEGIEDHRSWYLLPEFCVWTIERQCQKVNDYMALHKIVPNYFNKGLMYYTVPVEHLATSNTNSIVEGQYGVVRNHWYRLTVNSVSKFGRGIADPNEVIVPGEEEVYYYLGADLNVLAWKMVNQTVGF